MDIQEARKLKWDLESEILKLLKDYEKKTHGRVKSISVENTYPMGLASEVAAVQIEVEV